MSLLLAVAHQESHFKINAASSINAKGLFQITKPTWSQLVKQYGKQYGIRIGDVENPRANAIMGAFYIRDLISSLTKYLGVKPSVTDIYAGHFLGPTGVKNLLQGLQKDPNADASKMFPKPARDNPSIFFDKEGKPRTLKEVYLHLYGKVGLQYLKFAEKQELAFAPVNVDFIGKTDTQSPQPVQVAISAPKSNTVAVPVDVNIPPAQPTQVAMNDQSTDTKQNQKTILTSSKQQPTPEYNFIRSRGKLIQVG